jgi:diacylglycerol kinase family enzyme
MDVLIIRERGLGSLASLYSLVESGGRHLKNQNFHYHKAREVTIMPRDVHQGFLNIDGEVAAAVETKISVMPKAITVFFALPVQ